MAVEPPGAEPFSGQDYISQWPPRALGPLRLCVLRRPGRFFPDPRRLGSLRVRGGGGPERRLPEFSGLEPGLPALQFCR